MLDTGSVLTCICNEIAILFETTSIGYYNITITIYSYLLSLLHYHINKRGKWYIRICINYYNHCNNILLALVVVKKGLSDSTVKMGDRLDLQKRYEKLSKLYNNTTSSNSNDGNNNGNDNGNNNDNGNSSSNDSSNTGDSDSDSNSNIGNLVVVLSLVLVLHEDLLSPLRASVALAVSASFAAFLLRL
jgi:hypothetical protein